MPSSHASRSRAVVLLGAAALAVVVLIPGAVSAQTPPPPECLADGGVLLSSLNCLGNPAIDKFFEAATFSWGTTDQLAVNTGNDLQLYNINDPGSPVEGDDSNFGVGNQGDSDYDLLNYSICDDCRYGVATYKLGTVLFDLGTGALPNFGTKQFYGTSLDPRGAFTFKFDSQQYLIANYLPNDCGSGYDATLYSYDGVTSIDPLACIDVPGFSGKFINGVVVQGDAATYLYLGFYDNWIYIYEVQDFGSAINLEFIVKSPIRASMARGKGLAIDETADLAVSSFVNDGMHVWDISNPASPVQRSFRAGNLGLAAMRYPFAWVAQPNNPNSSITYNIEDPANPVVLDPNFWDPEHPWNSHSSDPDNPCEWPTGAVFSDDATTMYLARYNVTQMIDFTACTGPIQPVADMSITPTPAFPGDSVTVTDTSIGSVETKTIWVTRTSDPLGGLNCGDLTLTAGDPSTLICPIQVDIQAAEVRWAHVAVANADFPCNPAPGGLCPAQQLASVANRDRPHT